MSLRIRNDGAFNTITATQGVFKSLITDALIFHGTLIVTGTSGDLSVEFNNPVGMVTFTDVPTIAVNDSLTVTILNDLVRSDTAGLLTLMSTTAAAPSAPRVSNVAFLDGQIDITITNSAGIFSTGISDYTFSFILFD